MSDLARTASICRMVLEPGSWAALIERVSKVSGWEKAGEVFTYLETLRACSLAREEWPVPEPPVDAREGRVFEHRAELRWVRMADGRFRGWLLRELEGGTGESGIEGPFETLTRDYFLLGKYDGRTEAFVEARYPGIEFRYPVDGEPASGKRARIEVREYRRREPSWQASADEGHIDEMLAADILVAHRFIRVTAG